MGSVEKISCSICGQTWKCRIGCGLQHGRLETVTKLFDEKTVMQIKTNDLHNPIPLYDFAYQLASCRKCKSVIRVPVLTMLEEHLRYVGVCPECGEKIECIEEVETALCPICHEKRLQREKIGHWD